MSENGTKYVRWPNFVWAIGILIFLFGIAMTTAGTAMKTSYELKTDVEVTKNNVEWIRETMEREGGNTSLLKKKSSI